MVVMFAAMILLHAKQGQCEVEVGKSNMRSLLVYMYSRRALSPVMTLFAYRLTDTRELAVTAVPGKRRNATRCHMAKEGMQLQMAWSVMRMRQVETGSRLEVASVLFTASSELASDHVWYMYASPGRFFAFDTSIYLVIYIQPSI